MSSIFRKTFSGLMMFALLVGCSGKKDSTGDDKPGDNTRGDVGKTDRKDRPEDTSSKDAKPTAGTKSTDSRRDTPDFTLTPSEFKAEVRKGRTAFKEKFDNKTVELQGVVDHVTNISIQFGKGGDSVSCMPRDREVWKKVLPGQSVKIRGKVSPIFGTDPSDCVIVEITGAGPDSLTAEQLAKDAAADSEALKQKYEEKYLFVSGEIEKIEKEDISTRVTLKTATPKTQVIIAIPKSYEAKDETLKIGQQIKFLAELAAAESDRVYFRQGRIWK